MRDSGAWLKLMAIAFVANGLGPFGLKVLDGLGLSSEQSRYLVWWYAGGCLFALIALGRGWVQVRGKDCWLGAAMGLCSLGGQAFTGMALSHGVPGHIAFPVTTGGSLFFVAAAGIVLFKERVGVYGLLGIALGICSLVLLSIT
jgi:multidrug transporter EmrE-like cation transporter